MTGGGFGGCTISLVRPDAVARFGDRVAREYPGRTSRTARTWQVRASAGAGFA
jgi:galactokinase